VETCYYVAMRARREVSRMPGTARTNHMVQGAGGLRGARNPLLHPSPRAGSSKSAAYLEARTKETFTY